MRVAIGTPKHEEKHASDIFGSPATSSLSSLSSPTSKSTEQTVDVVIIGGGIAGISIAEYLARHTKKTLDIRILDRASKLGSGSSCKLEGWYHTGTLYSAREDVRTFAHAVQGVADMINSYSNYFDRCNLTLKETQPGVFQPRVVHHENGWFDLEPIHVIHPGSRSLEVLQSPRVADTRAEFVRTNLKRVINRIEAAYGKPHNWKNFSTDKAEAPTYTKLKRTQIDDDMKCSLVTDKPQIHKFCKNFDKSTGIESEYTVIASTDRSLKTDSVIRDLTGSCLACGVHIETGIEIEHIEYCGDVQNHGDDVNVKSIYYRKSESTSLIELKARVFVFAVGAGFEKILPNLPVNAKLRKIKSAMVVVQPAITDIHFVRMSPMDNFHFNHIYKQIASNQDYSLMADSGYTPTDADAETEVQNILKSAHRYFGDKILQNRTVIKYECTKTEFVCKEAEKRSQNFWIEGGHSTQGNNFICVVPGKFSFFPTVAAKTFEKLKDMLKLDAATTKSPETKYLPLPEITLMAAEMVAEYYPVRLLEGPQSLLDKSLVR